jgi:formylmethanofuran--tetrahydromethanopterin N-formyltransferase
MKLNGVVIDDTFAEAFPMKATRLIITAVDTYWAFCAANSFTGFASSVIDCGCEAAIERELKPSETPDGRPGIAVIIFAMSTKQLTEQVRRRVGQSVMTTATSACFSGTPGGERIPLGRSLRYFGDGYQMSKKVNGTRYWRIPVMHGEFVCEETTGVVPAVGGGNFLVMARTSRHGLAACRAAVRAIQRISGAGTTFPGGIVGSGSKIGSRYPFLTASTNHRFCPTIKGLVPDTELTEEVGSVLEIIIDGMDEPTVRRAMRDGIRAVCAFGPRKGIYRVSAGQYGGKLGPYHFHLHDLLR